MLTLSVLVPASDDELLVAPSPSHAAAALVTSFETPSKEPEELELLPHHHLPKHGPMHQENVIFLEGT